MGQEEVLAQSSPVFRSPQTLAQISGRLASWQFDPSNLQFVFRTSGGVQPRAQLISNPTRLVIDLPGIALGRPPVTQVLRKEFRVLRLGQFDRQTARIVIELDPGFTLDPQKIRFRGLNPTSWTVQLPKPQRLQGASNETTVTEITTTSSPSTLPTPLPPSTISSAAPTQVQNVRVTDDGLFIRTSGGPPRFRVQRSRDRRQVILTLDNTTISSQVSRRDLTVNRFDVSRVRITQVRTPPPSTQLTLFVKQDSPDWDARLINFRNLDGLALIPTTNAAAASAPAPRSASIPDAPAGRSAVPTIEAIELDRSTGQLLIKADQPFVYTSGWDRATGAYRINLSAQLAPGISLPSTGGNSPLLRIQLRREGANTVVLLYPSAGTQIGTLSQPSSEQLALDLGRSQTVLVPPAQQPIPVPPPETIGSASPPRPIAVPPPSNPTGTAPLPNAPRGRYVVVIDPGHGGPDPGAVGIGGLQEKELVLDVSRQVSAKLEQQGVNAVLSRSDDRDLDLEPRVQLARQVNATIFVSIHANSISLSRPDISGIETYFYSSSASERLARIVQRNLLQTTGATDRGVHTARFYVLRRTTMPAILIEIGFVTGQEDAARLSTANYRTLLAEAITRGILEYLQNS
jgi:N-acetylmuramoyl-L-alanine amidase